MPLPPDDFAAAADAAAAGRPLRVTVLLGGPSAEREVSLASGTAIAAALERCGHEVRRRDIGPRDVSALDEDDIDAVFIALHGEFGESGEVQQLCEDRSLPYTGSDPVASRIAMDKAASKQRFRRCGLATPDWMILENFHAPKQRNLWLAEIEPPAVVKPVNGGSSVDVTIALDAAARDEALDELLDAYHRALVERFVPGRELTVGILGEQALPLMEIVPGRPFYDYTAKYADGAGTRYVFDHGLPGAIVDRVREDALAAHRAVGARDLSRVDFILDEENVPQVLEINTIPGFTSHSLLPMAAQRAGISFEQLVDRLARMAFSRSRAMAS
jgi:D-alanine-D-alanine ligase